MPVYWGKNQKGMQAEVELEGNDLRMAKEAWLDARDDAVGRARYMAKLGMHKQLVNRVIEPWMWITVIVTATEWSNFMDLRCHPAAQPEIRHIAEMMRDSRQDSIPKGLQAGEWHIPYLVDEDIGRPLHELLALSSARCARVSYLTHDGKHQPDRDLVIHKGLADNGHWSPLEHQARAHADPSFAANFFGYTQFRHLYGSLG